MSISPPRHLSQSSASPVSPPLSPTEGGDDIPQSLPHRKDHKRLASFPVSPVHSDVSQTSIERGKQLEEMVSPVEKPLTPPIMNLMSTPPESPRSSSPITSLPHLSKPFNKTLHARSHSLPSVAPLNNVNEDNHHSNSNTNGVMNNGVDIPINDRRNGRSEHNFRRDSSPSPPNMQFNVSQIMFLQIMG